METTDTVAVVDKTFISMKVIVLKILFVTSFLLGGDNPNLPYCPNSHTKAQDIIEKFLTSPTFSSHRSATGTNGLSTSQITVLVDSNSSHVTKCQQLRNIDVFDPSNDTYRITVYYKVGSFYFVSMPVVQNTIMHDGEEIVISGSHYLSILDSNLNILRTVAI